MWWNVYLAQFLLPQPDEQRTFLVIGQFVLAALIAVPVALAVWQRR